MSTEVTPLQAYNEIFEKVVLGDFPLLPAPHWPQEPAHVAWYIDMLRENIENT
jgi:hypothetical protein